ncbi:Tripartite motif-containing protein 45 [Desmophyllum pertusum]|uniref:Tripartite motif-containing protein 45 n=1 Tax=Desmophyllum pertusum TaxID=174260 RepID=A0A9W9ZI29_9CNID|nr:Tripartite motif-containing protein 45 [Desmophyllum pertusum]
MGDVGIATLKVEVEGQNVRGSPFNWEVNPENRFPSKNLPTSFFDTVKQNYFRKGMHSWKLQLVSFSPDQKGSFDGLEIGCTIGCIQQGLPVTQDERWCWYYNPSQRQKCKRSDGQQPSITSVQDRDVFTVFLNLETKKLIIYNVRSKQAELFTGVDGEQAMLPVISPDAQGGQWQRARGGAHLTLAIDQ